ncbi:short transient receptor potential channel 2-like [Bolinopsis microptera]|uniref:short transient receptor potential channel 2-like n=1 Tax=Bolinopsis microptera TaxID=2820187 RepID=UPI00307AAFE1
MNNIDRMWEAREILSFPVDLMRMAIDQRKKKFVSHPFCQQIIFDRWYGDLANKMFYGKTAVAIKYIFSPLFVLPLLLKFFFIDTCRGIPVMESNLASLLRMKFTPFLCFITDALNYVIFLSILVGVCLTEQETDAITLWEYALYVCVISRIFIELDLMIQQGWKRYFLNVWNYVDILILGLLCVAALYKGCVIAGVTLTSEIHEDTIESMIKILDEGLEDNTTSKYYRDNINSWSKLILNYRHFLNISYVYAVTEFVLFLRLLTLLEVTRSMGPMMIALKYLLLDVLKFSVLLGSTIVGTSITIYSMSVRLEKWSLDVNDLCDDTISDSNKGGWQKDKVLELVKNLTDIENINDINITLSLCTEDIKIVPPKSFGNFLATIRSIMWSTFGLFDVENVEEPFEASTMSFINIMLVLYILLSCVLLLNMLIGILSSTFDRIQENCDIEWKYARSELLKEYSRGQPFLIPFSTFLFPIVYWFRRKLRKEQKMESKKSNKFLSPAAEQVKRDKIISDVCERFKSDYTEDSDDECAFRPRTSRPGTRQRSRPGTRQDDFDVRVRQLRRQKSELIQFKRRD